jgi:hypothetical protein
MGADSTAPYVGGVEQRRKSQSTFYVSVKLWLHSNMHTWVPFSSTQRMLKIINVGAIWNFS